MKKIILVFIAALCFTIDTKAQKAESMEMSGNDAIAVLEAMNVHMNKFDFNMFQDKTYKFSIYIDEYVKGEEKKRVLNKSFGTNRMSITDEFIAKALEGESSIKQNIDKENKLLLRCQEVSVYVLPDTDSTVTFKINLLNGGSMGRSLKLRLLEGIKRAMYDSRPFEINEYDASSPEIPLIFYGSFWFDEKFKIYRFCSKNKIKKDLSSDIVEKVPHFYVIGVRVEEVK